MWLLEFNLVRRIEFNEDGVDQMVDAFRQNDPYFPIPLQDHPVSKRLWNRFAESFLKVATTALRDEEPKVKGLHLLFLRRLVDEHRRKMGKD